MEVDVETQCAVPMPPDGKPCQKNLSCNSHSFSEKRAVRGRSAPFDQLLRKFVLEKAKGGMGVGTVGGGTAAHGRLPEKEKKQVDLMDMDVEVDEGTGGGMGAWEVLKPR
jgi:hypothetical protein